MRFKIMKKVIFLFINKTFRTYTDKEHRAMAGSRMGIGVVIWCMLILATFAGIKCGQIRQTGFYLIATEAATPTALPAPNNEQQVIRYDYKFLRNTDSTQARYLLLPRKPDVALELAKAPELNQKGENGFPDIRLELTTEAARSLEKLTREHLGQHVLFMLDGEPVTIHKIRSVISDGQFRLSRCTDTACQYIYVRLKSKP
jgi:preprotein translocase subunit SecD